MWDRGDRPLPPGLNGYVAGQQFSNQQQSQQLGMLSQLMALQGHQEDRAMKQQMMPLQMQQLQQKIAEAQQQQQLMSQLGGMQAQATPEQLDMIGQRLALAGHPGAATVMSIADKRRKAAEIQQALQSLKSGAPRPAAVDPQEIQQAADQGTPPPPTEVPSTPGAASFLFDSPHVGQPARQFQSAIDSGAVRDPAVIENRIAQFAKIHSDAEEKQRGRDEAAARMREVQAQINARQDKGQAQRIEIRNMFPPQNAAAASAPSPFSPDAIDNAAARYAIDGTLPTNLGRGTQGAANTAKILNRAAEMAKENGQTAEGARIDQIAGKANGMALGQLAKQKNLILSFENTAFRNAQLVLDKSEKVDRVGSPVIDRWIQAGKVNIAGDTAVAELNLAVRTLVNEYAKITSSATGGGVTSDTARKEIDTLLRSAQTKEQVRSVVSLMKQEMENRRLGYEDQERALKGSFSRGRASAAPAEAPAPAPAPKVSDDDLIKKYLK